MINRTPSPSLDWITPFQSLYGDVPDYASLRVFGSLYYVSTLSSHRMKFDPRATATVFVGYPAGIKGYRLYDLQIKKFFVSRDVIFHETIFPFHGLSNTDIPNHFPDLVLPKSFDISTITNLYLGVTATTDATIIPDVTDATAIPDVTVATTDAAVTRPSDPAITDAAADVTVDINDPVADQAIDSFGAIIHQQPEVVPRRSPQSVRPPSYLRDYDCALSTGSLPSCTFTKHPLQQCLSNDRLAPFHVSFTVGLFTNTEPQFYHHAVVHKHWRYAMAAELDAMEANRTWVVVPLPSGHHSISCKWVYRIKYKSDGSIEHYKARLVAKGYTQQEGLSHIETFPPVAK